jgi:hypothetical protein
LYVVIAVILLAQDKQLTDAEELARRALSLAPQELINTHLLAAILVRRDKWYEAVEHIRRYLTEGSPEDQEKRLPEAIGLFHYAVRHGRAHDAIGLLDEVGLGERWRPLREALRAAADGPEVLLAVAPEVRVPAEQILQRLTTEAPKSQAGTPPAPGS